MESHLLVKLRNLVLRTILKAGHIDGRSESKRSINSVISITKNKCSTNNNIYDLDDIVDGK